MRPGQNKRIRGRGSRKGPNPLTRSYESNGPDVKIRGTAQHVAEKYLQLARDAQVSGDIVMAESLLQHAEHYFRLIAAAQQPQQQNGYSRQSFEADTDAGDDDDDDFSGISDRFAPLSERLPQAAYQPAAPPYAPPQAQPHFAQPQPQPQPQPFEERPIGENRHERPARQERPERPERPFGGRGRDRERGVERNAETGERGHHQSFDRNRDGRRFHQRAEAAPAEGAAGAPLQTGAVGLPSFITAPPARAANPEADAPEPFVARQEHAAGRDHEGVNFHLSARRRRRPRPPMDEAAGAAREDDAPRTGELPLEPDGF
jgi:hypothetical protein